MYITIKKPHPSMEKGAGSVVVARTPRPTTLFGLLLFNFTSFLHSLINYIKVTFKITNFIIFICFNNYII